MNSSRWIARPSDDRIRLAKVCCSSVRRTCLFSERSLLPRCLCLCSVFACVQLHQPELLILARHPALHQITLGGMPGLQQPQLPGGNHWRGRPFPQMQQAARCGASLMPPATASAAPDIIGPHMPSSQFAGGWTSSSVYSRMSLSVDAVPAL